MDFFNLIMLAIFILVFLIAYLRITKVIDVVIGSRIKFLTKKSTLQTERIDKLSERIDQLSERIKELENQQRKE